MESFSENDLLRIMRASGGEPGEQPAGGILDMTFEDLDYDSLARLEVASRIQREFSVQIDDDDIDGLSTPRGVLSLVHEKMRQRD